MGLVMRDGINRLRHAKGYSGFFETICINLGLDRLHRRDRKDRRPDPREMAKVRSDRDLGHQRRSTRRST